MKADIRPDFDDEELSEEDLAAELIEALDLDAPVASNESVFTIGPAHRDQRELVKVIGERLRRARELANLSQTEAARRIGYANPSKLSKIESATDTNSVPLWLIQRAAQVYEVSIDYLFNLVDEAENYVPRGMTTWLADKWEQARARDLAVLDRLHRQHAVIAKDVAELVTAARSAGDALSRVRELNPHFDSETRGGFNLMKRVGHAEAVGRRAETGLRKLGLIRDGGR